jgi:hypothetical protein
MPHITIMAAVTTIGLFFSMRQTINNRLNPVYLAIAASGYQIQSQLLHIPDRYSFFSSGPPRAQVEEGAAFAQLFTLICYTILGGWFVVLRGSSRPNARPFCSQYC